MVGVSILTIVNHRTLFVYQVKIIEPYIVHIVIKRTSFSYVINRNRF